MYGTQPLRDTEESAVHRLEGIVPEDWHVRVVLLKVYILRHRYVYKSTSMHLSIVFVACKTCFIFDNNTGYLEASIQANVK